MWQESYALLEAYKYLSLDSKDRRVSDRDHRCRFGCPNGGGALGNF